MSTLTLVKLILMMASDTGPQISMQRSLSLEFLKLYRKKFSNFLLDHWVPVIYTGGAKVWGSVCYMYSGPVITLIFSYVPHLPIILSPSIQCYQ